MVYYVIVAVALLVGGFFVFRSFSNKNKEQGFANVLFTTGLGLIVASFGGFIDKLIQVAVVFKNGETTKESVDAVSTLSEPNIVQLVVGLILVAFGVYFTVYIKRKIYILNINAYFDNRIENHNKGLNLSAFEFKEREIDLIKAFKKGIDATSVGDIVELIEEKVTSFKNESKEFKRGYTGIAPIPLVALAGTFLKREPIHRYFEFDKIVTQNYYQLNKKGKSVKDYPVLECTFDFNNMNNTADEVALAVSITTEIPDADLSQFNHMQIVRLTVATPQDNTIKFEKQLVDYANEIMLTVQKIRQKMPNLKRIHLACSSQSCLALEIGKRVEDSRMQQIVCCFFNAQHPVKKYPWGIVINGNRKGDIVEY